MNDLLDFVLEAHGGLERWSGVSALTAKLAAGGPFWGQLGFPRRVPGRDPDHRHPPPARRLHRLDRSRSEPDLRHRPRTGRSSDRRRPDHRQPDKPRSSYAGYDLNSPWDALQVGYFLSYGLWNYLTTPYLLTYPGVQAREISPWQEDGQTWRRLHATFPASITTHSAEQVFYFGDDGLLRRLDYTVEADGGRAAHYTEGYKTFDGLAFPTRHQVYRRNPDGTPDRSLTAITLDIHDITAA